MQGILVVIEGIDGAGTTTQAKRLVARLAQAGVAAHLTREPSDGPVGLLLRQMLSGAFAPVDQSTLSLLFAADRADHIQREVAPALARGEVVVSDRWYHSSLAYQGADEERAWIRELNRRALRPDLTLLLRVDPKAALARRTDAGRSEEIFDALPMQERVAHGYDQVMAEEAASDRGRCSVEIIDGEATMDDVGEAVWKSVMAVVDSAR